MKKICWGLILFVLLLGLPEIGQSLDMSLADSDADRDCISQKNKNFPRILKSFGEYFGKLNRSHWYHLEYPTGITEILYCHPDDGWGHIVSTVDAGRSYQERHRPKAIGGLKTKNGIVYWEINAP